jgi:hypothetical protein
MLLIERVRFGNWLGLMISVVILGVIVFFAYDVQADKVRTDYREAIEPVILGDHIRGMTVRVEMIDATVVFQHMPDGSRAVNAQYQGSSESEVSISVQENEPGMVELTITERRPNRIPHLEEIGRGELLVFLPVGIPIENLVFTNHRGATTLDFRFLNVPRFDVRIDDALVGVALHLPPQGNTTSNLSIQKGGLQIYVDPNIPLQINGAPVGGRTELDENRYLFLEGGGIESRGGLTEFNIRLSLNMPDGSLIIQPPQPT